MIRLILHLETMEQVESALRFAQRHNVAVDAMTPVEAKATPALKDNQRKRAAKRKRKKAKGARAISQQKLTFTGVHPNGKIKTMFAYETLRARYSGDHVQRKELTTDLASLMDTRYPAASMMVAHWLEQGVLKEAQ